MTRREQAQATRLRMIEAALDSFVGNGYSATTMEKVAASAGVAVQTVYFTFKTKGDLLQAVYEHVVLGPDGVPPHLSSWWSSARSAPTVADAVAAIVGGTVTILERAAPLVWTVLGDDTARDGYERNEAMRRDGNVELISILSSKQPLREGLDAARARDVLLVLTGPQLYSQFTRELGWGRDEVEAWMVAAVLRELFGDVAGGL